MASAPVKKLGQLFLSAVYSVSCFYTLKEKVPGLRGIENLLKRNAVLASGSCVLLSFPSLSMLYCSAGFQYLTVQNAPNWNAVSTELFLGYRVSVW